MNVANSEAFDNPRSTPTDRQFAAAKYASEMIDSIASQLKINIVTAVQRGESFDQTERSARDAAFQIGNQALEFFIQLQGYGDLGPEIATEQGKILRRSATTTRTTIRSIFSMHCFDQFTYAPAAKKATQLLPISARMLLPKRQWSTQRLAKRPVRFLMICRSRPQTAKLNCWLFRLTARVCRW